MDVVEDEAGLAEVVVDKILPKKSASAAMIPAIGRRWRMRFPPADARSPFLKSNRFWEYDMQANGGHDRGRGGGGRQNDG